jgi:hypothetical protein
MQRNCNTRMRSGINYTRMKFEQNSTISGCSKVPLSLLIVILSATISLNVNYVLKDIEAENTIEGINFGFH